MTEMLPDNKVHVLTAKHTHLDKMLFKTQTVLFVWLVFLKNILPIL